MTNLETLKSFVSGQMSIEEFKDIYFSNQSLQNLLQEKLPHSMLININIQAYNGDINKVLQTRSWNTKQGKCSIHGFIELWLQKNSISCNTTQVYGDEYSFLISVMPDYINGSEAEQLIDKIIESVPEDMPKSKRVKEIKERIKVAFHLQDGKRPTWAQDTDWPFGKSGKPLKYVSRKRDGDLLLHTFKDVDTGEETVVEEYY